jgi:hypothetical protein
MFTTKKLKVKNLLTLKKGAKCKRCDHSRAGFWGRSGFLGGLGQGRDICGMGLAWSGIRIRGGLIIQVCRNLVLFPSLFF